VFNKIQTSIVLTCLLACAGILLAQEGQGRAGRQEGGTAQRIQNVQTFRQAFNTWFDELDKAFEQHDTEKMGLLREERKKNKQEWQARSAGRQGGGMWTRRNRAGQERPARAPAAGSPGLTEEEEKKILSVLEDMFQNERRGNMNVPPDDGKALRLLTEATGAKTVVEIGTSNGYSGIWFCLALKKTGGKLITHDIDERRAALARKNFDRAGVKDIVTLVLGDAHETVKKFEGPIDIVFMRGYSEIQRSRHHQSGSGDAVHQQGRSWHNAQETLMIKIRYHLETLFSNRTAKGVSSNLIGLDQPCQSFPEEIFPFSTPPA
jgi:hypothetical protein